MQPHDKDMLPECLQIFTRLEEKVDHLIVVDEKRNGKYDNHINESVSRVEKIAKLEEAVTAVKNVKPLIWTTLVTVILSAIAMVAYWNFMIGGQIRQIEVNTARLAVLEELHPRGDTPCIPIIKK